MNEKFPIPFPDPIWSCAKCRRDFEWWPEHGEPPHAFEVVTDKDGRQRQGGYICRACSPNITPE